ncbi:MAG: pyrimidine/purine nucleosidase domain-containing protein, partial [Pseudomonadales bacterium]
MSNSTSPSSLPAAATTTRDGTQAHTLPLATADAQVSPRGSLELLSQREVDALTNNAHPRQLYRLFRDCALAVLNTGSESDDAALIFDSFKDFEVQISRRTRGLKLIIKNAPSTAFVESRMIEGIRQHL